LNPSTSSLSRTEFPREHLNQMLRTPSRYPNQELTAQFCQRQMKRTQPNGREGSRKGTRLEGARPGEEREDEEGLPGDDAGEEGERGAQRDERVPHPRCHRHPGLQAASATRAVRLGTKAVPCTVERGADQQTMWVLLGFYRSYYCQEWLLTFVTSILCFSVLVL
jgi:hypothetical protein